MNSESIRTEKNADEYSDGGEYVVQFDSGMQELADMAGKFGENDTFVLSGFEGIEDEEDPDTKREYDEAKKKSVEQLTQDLERAKGYEIYGPELEVRLKMDEEAARLNTLAMEGDPNRDGALILVCAQHPLTPDGKPGKAFAARLDEAVLRYSLMKKQGQRVTVRVPGGVHSGDTVSLAEAGEKYLIENGVSEEDISVDGTEKNGTDEVTFAWDIFEQAQHRQFHICCGENQVFRNKMACIELLGILPYFHTAAVMEEPLHHTLGFEIANPNGGLRFLRTDGGVAVDDAARKKHTEG